MTDELERDEILGQAFDARLTRRLLVYMRPYLGLAAVSLLFLLLSNVAFLGLPWIQGRAIDLVWGRFRIETLAWLPGPLREGAAALGTAGQLLSLAGAYAALVALTFVTSSLQAWLMGKLGALIVRDIRDRLFAHIQRLPLAVFDKTPVGRWITRLTSDIEAISNLFTTGIIVAFGDLVLLGGIVVALLSIHPKLALASMAVLPVLAFATAVFRKRARDAYRLVRQHLARVNAYLQETVSGTLVTLLFMRQRENARRFERRVEDHYRAMQRSIRIHAVYVPVVTLLTGISVAVALGYGGTLVADGALTLGALVAFLWYQGHFVHPIQDLSEKYNIFQAAMASSERIFRILDTPQETEPLETGGERREAGGDATSKGAAIEFQDVSFAYDGEPVLRGLSFKARPGEHIALVGATGAGKTTIVSLLCRFYDPQGGRILVDGADLATRPRRWARSNVALVLQEPVIFSGDVSFNIRLGEESIGPEGIEAAARRARADVFIRRLPDGYRSPLPERGSSLSAGERQLVTYARALAFDRPILILDEATAHIDPETEGLIQEGLEELMRNRTTLVIAHRLATLRSADRILVLERGRLVEEGSHAELLAKGGPYARLHSFQEAPLA